MRLAKKIGEKLLVSSSVTGSYVVITFRLKEFLRERLVASGWRDELKESCKEVIRRKGLEKVTIEELVTEITPKGRGVLVVLRSGCALHFLFFLIFNSDDTRRYKSRPFEKNPPILTIFIRPMTRILSEEA